MACNNMNKSCNCKFNIKTLGVCDTKRVNINGSDRTNLNWSEISVPEVLCIPDTKPDIEKLDQVYVTSELTSVKLIETPFAYAITNRLAEEDEINALGEIYNAVVVGAGSILTLTGLVTTAVENLLAAILPIYITPTIQALIDTVNIALDTVDSIIDTITTLAADILELVNIGIEEALATLICEIIIALRDLLNSLITAIADLLAAVIALVNGLTGILDLTVLLGLLQTAINNLNTQIGAVLTLVTNLLALLGNTSYLVILPNEEGTCLTGRKLIVEGLLNQRVVYTGNVDEQSVHSAHYLVAFSAFIIVYAKFEGLEYTNELIRTLESSTPIGANGFGFNCTFNIENNLTVDLCEEFWVESCIEDIFANALDSRTIFKNVTLFLLAKSARVC